MYTNRRSRRVTKGYWPVSLGLDNKINFNVEYENSKKGKSVGKIRFGVWGVWRRRICIRLIIITIKA